MAGLSQIYADGFARDLIPRSTAPTFLSSTSYAVGDYVYYQGSLYRCTTAHTGTWVASHFTAVTVGSELKAKEASLQSEIDDVKSDLSDLEDTLVNEGIIEDVVDVSLLGYGTIASNGLLGEMPQETYQIYIVDMTRHESVSVSGIGIYAYYSDEPTYGSVATDGTRYFLSSSPTTITKITGANYLAIRVATGSTVSAEPTGERIEPITEKVANLETGMNQISESVYKVEDDVTEDGTVTADYYMGTNGNTYGPYEGAWRYITYDVTGGETYSVTAYAGQNCRLWLLKNDNTVISYSQDSTAVGLKSEVVTIPTTANKLIVNASTRTDEQISSISVQKIVPERKIKGDAITSNILAGKVLCCAGDSITYGADMDADGITNLSNIDVYQSDSAGVFTKVTNHFLKSWGYQIAERNNMTLYNAGVSGSTMQGISNRNGFSLADGRYTKLPDNIDYLVLWFGWNDTAYGTLGTINDTENTSYYGGYNVVLPYLINKYPYAKIALIVPFGTDTGHRNAIRELGNKWGVAVWDNYQGGTPLYYGKEDSVGVDEDIVTANRAKFQANGAHPNYKGHTQLGDMIEGFLRSI